MACTTLAQGEHCFPHFCPLPVPTALLQIRTLVEVSQGGNPHFKAGTWPILGQNNLSKVKTTNLMEKKNASWMGWWWKMLIMAVYGSFPCGVAASLSPNDENGRCARLWVFSKWRSSSWSGGDAVTDPHFAFLSEYNGDNYMSISTTYLSTKLKFLPTRTSSLKSLWLNGRQRHISWAALFFNSILNPTQLKNSKILGRSFSRLQGDLSARKRDCGRWTRTGKLFLLDHFSLFSLRVTHVTWSVLHVSTFSRRC